MILKSSVDYLCDVPISSDLTTVMAEPMLFGADGDFAYENGGALTKAFLEYLGEMEEGLDGMVIDSKAVLLMKGQFPCIPGWHLDDVWRNPNNNQPDFENAPYRSEHWMLLIGDPSRTEFVVGDFETSAFDQATGNVYQVLHSEVVEKKPPTVKVNPGIIYKFTDIDIHRGTAATKSGHRFFIRATRRTGWKKWLNIQTRNQIRKQVQIYIPSEEMGW